MSVCVKKKKRLRKGEVFLLWSYLLKFKIGTT